MRFRARIAVPLLSALALFGMAPAAQAVETSAPATSEVVTVGKLTPEQAQKVDAAGAKRTGLRTQGRALCYQAHVRGSDQWSAKLCTDGAAGYTGTVGQNKPIDEIYFEVGTTGALNFNVQAHWAEDGTGSENNVPPGTWIRIGNIHGQPLQAIHLRSTNETLKAAAHVQDVGWKSTDQWLYDQWIGSIGENRWMEAFWVAI
ncbi:UrcA family protein [Embleya sp. AB8]|uniref:UrcA family protein n=1 Tax=Embleya sp. AB8 TaxID=3156304 RepID=UPI003C783577